MRVVDGVTRRRQRGTAPRRVIVVRVRGEQFFDFEQDPLEMHDLAGAPVRVAEANLWRGRVIGELTGRPEGFTDRNDLLHVRRDPAYVRPP